MNAAIYARVSTSDQTCALQLRELRTYVKARGWKLAGEYVDTGWSGAKASRPELDRLMRDARARKVDCILVWKLDRWGRSVSNLVASLQELSGLGVRWIATTQNLDTDESNPIGKLLLYILAAIAEFERALAQERIKAGMAAAQARGVRFGRPLKVLPRARAAEMREEGLSWRVISRRLGIAVTTLRRAVPPKAAKPRQSGVPKPRKSTAPRIRQRKR